MATGWNGRFFNAEIGEGAPITFKFGMDKVLTMNILHLVKGGPNQARCYEGFSNDD